MQQPTLISLGTHEDTRGHLTFAEHPTHLPFVPVRTYFIQNVPAGATRAGVCHTQMNQLVIAAKGSLTVVTDDGHTKRFHTLATPSEALLIPPGYWRELTEFTPDTLALILTDMPHTPEEQVKDYQTFLASAQQGA